MKFEYINFSIFLIGFLIFAVVETLAPYRKRKFARSSRWPLNLTYLVISQVLIRVIFPMTLVGFAFWGQQNQFGLINYFAIEKNWLVHFFVILFLDFCLYFQHVLTHRWNFLWRWHKLHHEDQDLDVTSGIRFHPVEMVLSFCFKISVVLALGLTIEGVFIFQIASNIMSMFNHSNIQILRKIEPILRLVIVTPQMHIIHHSIDKKDQRRNFSVNFSCWDYIFSTYQKQARSEEIGVNP